jgi:hypothetical protein
LGIGSHEQISPKTTIPSPKIIFWEAITPIKLIDI